MTEREKLRRCVGCRNDFYNDKNDLGVKRCWSLEGAKLVRKIEVPIDQPPPYHQRAKWYFACFRRPRYAYLDPKEWR